MDSQERPLWYVASSPDLRNRAGWSGSSSHSALDSCTRFRCETDCKSHPEACVNEKFFIDMIDRMVEDGWRDLGYEVGLSCVV